MGDFKFQWKRVVKTMVLLSKVEKPLLLPTPDVVALVLTEFKK